MKLQSPQTKFRRELLLSINLRNVLFYRTKSRVPGLELSNLFTQTLVYFRFIRLPPVYKQELIIGTEIANLYFKAHLGAYNTL